MILRTIENELYILGTIWDGDGIYFLSEFNRMEKQFDTIKIKMHLYGGSVFDGNLIGNAIETSSSEISIEIIGIAASMGGVILLSVPPERASMVSNGYIMTHAPQMGSYGEAKDHESSAKLLRLIEKNFIKKLMMRLKITEAEAKAFIEKDNWIDADEAKKLGFVGSVTTSLVDTIYPITDPENYGETEVYNLFSNILLNPAAIGLPENTNQIFNDNMKKLLIQAFALTLVNEASSDTAFVEAIQEKFAAEKTGRETAEAALTKHKNEQITNMIAAANLEEADKETYKKIGETSGIDALSIVLKSKNTPTEEKAPNIGVIIQNGGTGTTVTAKNDWDFKKWQKEDPKGLEKMSETEPEKFKELFNANYK